MRIEISTPAHVVREPTGEGDSDDEDEIAASGAEISALDGVSLVSAGVDLSAYFDDDLLDLGVVGGKIAFRVHDRRTTVVVTYLAPERLDEGAIASLREYTVAQWADGIGEGGLRVETPTGVLLVRPSENTVAVSIAQLDDGQYVAGPSLVAKEAWLGRAEAVRAALAGGHDVNGVRGGYAALHLAVLGGHADICVLLIEAGADVHQRDTLGCSPLHKVAMANHMSDEDSARVAALLIDRGAEIDVLDDVGTTPVEFARMRKKPRLEEELRSRSATRRGGA